LPLKKTIFDATHVVREILTFNLKQFHAASFNSAITGIPNPATNPMSYHGRVEVVRNIHQIAPNVDGNLWAMYHLLDFVGEECDDGDEQSGDRRKANPSIRSSRPA